MSRDFDLVPIIGPNSLSDSNSNHQTLMGLNQSYSHNIIEDKFSGEYLGERFQQQQQQQQQNINKLRDHQKLRCCLCETPKQEYSLIRTCGEFVCRGCFNYEGKDRVEQLIENARQFKFAHLVHSSNDDCNGQILKFSPIVESGDPSILRPLDKQAKLSHPSLNCSSNDLNNNTTANIVAAANNKGLKEPQQRRSSSSKEKFGEQLNKTDNSLSGRKRSNWRQTEAQQTSSTAPISSDPTLAKVSLSSVKQSKTVLPQSNDNFTSSPRVESKQNSSSSSAPLQAIQKRPLNQQRPVVYKQKFDNSNLIEPKLFSNTTIAQNPSLCLPSSSDVLNQLEYKTVANEEQEIDDSSLSLQLIEQIQPSNRFQFDSNNLTTYPLLFPQKNLALGNSQGNIQDGYHHPSLFRHPTNIALQSPNAMTVYHQAPSQELLARMSVGGGSKRGRSTLIGNQCNNLNGQNFSFGSYSIMPSNILYQAGANLQGLYGSPGSIYATYHSPYQQLQQQPLSPPSQSGSHGQQHKSPSLLASPNFSFSNNSSSSNSLVNYTSLVQHPKGAQFILDPRLRNLSSNQEQRESFNNQQTNKANLMELQFLDNNNTLQFEQQSNNKSRHQNITKQEQTTFERGNVSPVTSPTHKSLIRDQTIDESLSNIDHIYIDSQSSPQQDSVQPKRPQNVPHIPLHSRSSLVKSLQIHHNNSLPTSSSLNGAEQQQAYSHESRTIDGVRDLDSQRPGKGASKIGAPDKSSPKHHNVKDDLDKQKETPSRSISQQKKENASILRQKLSDQRLNKASSRNFPSEQIEDTIVIDVEDEADVDKTNNTTTPSSSSLSSRRTISDTNDNDNNNNQFSSFKQPSSHPQQSSNSQSLDSVNQTSTEDRPVSRQATGNSTSIRQNVDNVHSGSSKNGANSSPENNSNIDKDNNLPGFKLNCLICSKNLVDRHFVQCPSVLSHKFCFSCTRNSISDQREKHKPRAEEEEEEKIYCLSGKMCPLIGQKEPWTFMTSEVETIFREKNKGSNSPDQVKNSSSSSSSSSSSPSLSNQQKFKRRTKSNNDERIKKRVLIEEPSNRKPPSRTPKSFDLDKRN